MPGGGYSALSGMRSRLEDLDRIATDLSNLATPGYKTERAARKVAERDQFGSMLASAVDVAGAATKTDLRQGTIGSTGRDLDVALDGPGFFVVNVGANQRYTRNGSFTRNAEGVLVTAEGHVVEGESGAIKLGKGPVTVDEKGNVRTGATVAGKLRVVDVPEGDLVRESGSRFAVRDGVSPDTLEPRIVSKALEASNVSLVDRMAALTEVSRGFDSLQRGVSTLFNEIDSRAISELGRR